MANSGTAGSDVSSATASRRFPKRQATTATTSAMKVKQENAIIKLSSTSPEPPGSGWQHPDELPFIDASSWPQEHVIKELITQAISIPGKPPTRMEQWTTITSANGETTLIPSAYRIPLLFAAQFQWSSLQLVLGVEDPVLRAKEWAQFKGSIMHVSRVCQAFLAAARGALDGGWGMSSRKWRCATFDRVLTRYRMRWMLSTPEQLREFHEIHGEHPYQRDVLKCHWKGIACQGFNGFKVSEERILSGVGIEEFISGLRKHDGDWVWLASHKDGIPAESFLNEWRQSKEWKAAGDDVSMDSTWPQTTNDNPLPLQLAEVTAIPPISPLLSPVAGPSPTPSPLPSVPPTPRPRKRQRTHAPAAAATATAAPPYKVQRSAPIVSSSPNNTEMGQTVSMLLDLITACNPSMALDRRIQNLEAEMSLLRQELDGDDDDVSTSTSDDMVVVRGTGILRPVGDGCATPVKFSRKGSHGHLG